MDPVCDDERVDREEQDAGDDFGTHRGERLGDLSDPLAELARPLFGPDTLVLDVRIAPEGVRARLARSINRPKKRALGLFKMENEYLGRVREHEFEIWERGQHAVHARGRVRGRRGGTRIEARFVLPARTRVLLPVFFALYLTVALGIALRDPRDLAAKTVVAALGALLIGAIFALGAARQRADLRTFLERVFGDVPRI